MAAKESRLKGVDETKATLAIYAPLAVSAIAGWISIESPSLPIRAGQLGHKVRTKSSHCSSRSRNLRGLAYSALPS
jgi:hypothetical protein